jgi:hypothetical protein
MKKQLKIPSIITKKFDKYYGESGVRVEKIYLIALLLDRKDLYVEIYETNKTKFKIKKKDWLDLAKEELRRSNFRVFEIEIDKNVSDIKEITKLFY